MNDRNTFTGYRWMKGCPLLATDTVVSRPANEPNRHSAIWTKLPDWHSYKGWVNRVREGSKDPK